MIRNLMHLDLINIKYCTILFDIVQIKNKVFQYWNHSYKVLVFMVIVRGVYIPYTYMYIYTYMGCLRCKILGFSVFVSSVWSMRNVSLGGMIHVMAISLFMGVERTFISKEILLVQKEDEIYDERRLIEVASWNNGARINRMKSPIWVSFRSNFNLCTEVFLKSETTCTDSRLSCTFWTYICYLFLLYQTTSRISLFFQIFLKESLFQ